MNRPPSPFVVLLLVLGLILPKATAGLAAVGLAGTTVVICSGDKLVTITLDADGNPISSIASEEPCGLVVPVTDLSTPKPDWTPAERRMATALATPTYPPALAPTGPPPPRAPPFA